MTSSFVEGLVKHFPIKAGVFKHTVGHVKAVDGVDLTVRERETLGVVGESGCGKTTLGRTIMKLLEPTAGRIIFEGRDLATLSRRQMRPVRRDLQIVFQDLYASLNPRMTVRRSSPSRCASIACTGAAEEDGESRSPADGRPESEHEPLPAVLLGGQRQRIGVARALALEPRLIVLDEPVSALDVSIQAQVVNLLARLQEEPR